MATIEGNLRNGAISLREVAQRCRALGDAEVNWEREFEPVMAFAGLVAAHEAPPL